jgi:hypothetical protein
MFRGRATIDDNALAVPERVTASITADGSELATQPLRRATWDDDRRASS